MTKKTKLLILFLLLFVFLGTSFIYAQKPLEITYPQIPGATTPTATKEALPDYIRYIFLFSLYLGALIAFGSFIYGGIRYLTSTGSPPAIKDAKSQITAGILGLIILVSGYLILNTINPQLVALEVSFLGKAPSALPAAGPPKPKPVTFIEIPLGNLIENLWGEKNEPKKTDCYNFDLGGINPTGDATNLLTNHDRLDCIEKISKAIQIKGKKLKEPIKELQKLYDCQNCCRDCCENACGWAECKEICDLNEITGHWEHCPFTCCEGTKKEGCWDWGTCGDYDCCEGEGMVKTYAYSCQKCPYSCCEFFEECLCTQCGFEAGWCERCNCICIKEDEEGEPACCNFEKDSAKPYEDLLVRSLIDKDLLNEEEKENDPYKGLVDIKTALRELRLKLGLFPLTEELLNNKRICCPDDICPPDEEIGVIDCLLSNPETKDLIIKILIGEPVDEDKLKEILKIKSVMTYLIESGLLFADKNSAKTALIVFDLLKNEVAINEIAWMGTVADPNDEWIELYNNTKENISFETENGKWELKTASGSIKIELSGIIPAQGFYLLENEENAVSDIKADSIYSGNLADSGEKLELYDEFGNLVEEVDCSSSWFTGDESSKTSMERINPKEEPEWENWATNLSIEVKEEMAEYKKEHINGVDRNDNPIFGTPKKPNSAGRMIVSYPPFNSLVAELRGRIRKNEELKEKLILVLRKDENLARMLKNKEGLRDILVGEDWRFKNLLTQREVLRILLEDKDNLETLFANDHLKKIIKDILIRSGDWKEEDDEAEEWDALMDNLDEVRINLKLINDFQRDLAWVLEASDFMRKCDDTPISYEQFRIPQPPNLIKIEMVPEWEKITKEIPLIGPDPAIFYCHKPLW